MRAGTPLQCGMGQPDLPPDVLDLIARHLDTMEQVEALLLLRRNPDREWQAGEVALEVHTSPEKALAALEILHKHSMVSRSAGEPRSYRYSPATPALHTAVENLEVAYNTRPVTLVKALYEYPARPIQSFADSFRLRKTDDKGK